MLVQSHKVTVAILLLINTMTVFSHRTNLRNKQQQQISPLRTNNNDNDRNDDNVVPTQRNNPGIRNEIYRDSVSRSPRIVKVPTSVPSSPPSMSPSSSPSTIPSLVPTPFTVTVSSPSTPSYTNCTILRIDIQTDYFPEETSAEILEATKQVRYWEYSNFTQPDYKYTFETCLNRNGCYLFKIYDSSENGICCAAGSGYYSLSWEDACWGQ